MISAIIPVVGRHAGQVGAVETPGSVRSDRKRLNLRLRSNYCLWSGSLYIPQLATYGGSRGGSNGENDHHEEDRDPQTGGSQDRGEKTGGAQNHGREGKAGGAQNRREEAGGAQDNGSTGETGGTQNRSEEAS